MGITIPCLRGTSASKEVLLGTAKARDLCRWSFADILDEASGTGYQRPFNARHSADFRRYIAQPGSTTIPLTLSLRKSRPGWRLEGRGQIASLFVENDAVDFMAQVDCQHRLGKLNDSNVKLPFMLFFGLNEREEMEIFNIINSKARGLSSSLLDYHAAQLTEDLARDRPELYITLRLNTDETSPWQGRLILGGKPTSGLMRVVSLRMMQRAVDEYLKSTDGQAHIAMAHDEATARLAADGVYDQLISFWHAVSDALPDAWAAPRRHVLTKGVGLFALTKIASDITREAVSRSDDCSRELYFRELSAFTAAVDWTNQGSFEGFGGENGVRTATSFLREMRNKNRLRIANAR